MAPTHKLVSIALIVILGIIFIFTANFITNVFLVFGLMWTLVWMFNFLKGKVWLLPGRSLVWSKTEWIYRKTNPLGFWLYICVFNIPISIILFLIFYMRINQGI